MKKKIFTLLAGLNRKMLPSYTKKQLDLASASKAQLALIAYRYWVTKNALD